MRLTGMICTTLFDCWLEVTHHSDNAAPPAGDADFFCVVGLFLEPSRISQFVTTDLASTKKS